MSEKFTHFLVVCPARATTWGWKSLTVPDSGELLVNDKGVLREEKSERSQSRKISVWRTEITYKAELSWASLPNKAKP